MASHTQPQEHANSRCFCRHIDTVTLSLSFKSQSQSQSESHPLYHLSIQTGHADAGTLILLASVLLSPLGSGGLTAKPAHPRSDEERSIQAAQ